MVTIAQLKPEISCPWYTFLFGFKAAIECVREAVHKHLYLSVQKYQRAFQNQNVLYFLTSFDTNNLK